ncbi:MAG: hypothetical protein JWO36_6921 [Myxococcales bacterium]|nr:hypothetical protein [Myxococcales bacterium]
MLLLRMPDGRVRQHSLNGLSAITMDGFVAAKIDARWQRRFVRMLVLEPDAEPRAARNPDTVANIVVITPPDQGAVAPNVVRVPEAPHAAAIIDTGSWEALADWMLRGGRLAALSIADLAQLACIATPQFAALIGEVAAQRALELLWESSGPLRGGSDVDAALHPLTEAAKSSPRAADALMSALAYAAGERRRRSRR